MTGNLCTLNNSAKADLLSAMKWLKFLNVLMIVMFSIMLLAGIALMFTKGSAMYFIGYLFAIFLYAYPIMQTFTLIKNARNACKEDNQNDFELLFDNMRSVLKYYGILTIVLLSIYIVFIVVLVGVFMHNML